METLKVLYPAETLTARIQELAQEIEDHFSDRDFTAVVVLKGAFFFAGDLLRSFQRSVDIQFVELKSYPGTESSGEVKIHYWQDNFNVQERDVLVIQDILDTGVTLDFLVKKLEQLGVRSVAICCLLDKPSRRRVAVRPHFVGFVINDVFVVGYGLDYQGRYRNLPYIAEVVPGEDSA